MSNLRILEGGRAKFAYECAQAGNKIKKSGAYKSYVKKLPMLIKTNGIGAAFAFVLSKSDKEAKDKKGYAYYLLYQQTQIWLKENRSYLVEIEQDGKKIGLDPDNGKDLIWMLVRMHSHEYRAVTVEVLAFLNWLRRFAEGLIEADEDESGE